ncbi:MAG: hypothetical protein IIX93_10320, partial [Clostridia bacterium]|nr:hypothetical protein [Clostridia bacterium]
MNKRIIRLTASLLMAILLLVGTASDAFAIIPSPFNNNPAFSLLSSKSFTLLNMSGSSITEVYIYPSYNSSWGEIRNQAWIYNGREATITFTNSEYNMDYVSWSMRIGINKGRYVSYSLWEDVSPTDLVSSGKVTLLSNGYGGYTLDYTSTSSVTTQLNKNSFKINNMSGNPIIEVYIYPMNNSNFGKMRNDGWVYNGDSVTVTLNSNELNLNVNWCLRIGVRKNGRAYYTYWENVDISDLINYGPITVYTGSNGWLSYYYD